MPVAAVLAQRPGDLPQPAIRVILERERGEARRQRPPDGVEALRPAASSATAAASTTAPSGTSARSVSARARRTAPRCTCAGVTTDQTAGSARSTRNGAKPLNIAVTGGPESAPTGAERPAK